MTTDEKLRYYDIGKHIDKLIQDEIEERKLVAVVRCKDCKNHDDCICVVCEDGNTVVCMKQHKHVPKDHYCGYGERI